MASLYIGTSACTAAGWEGRGSDIKGCAMTGRFYRDGAIRAYPLPFVRCGCDRKVSPIKHPQFAVCAGNRKSYTVEFQRVGRLAQRLERPVYTRKVACSNHALPTNQESS